MLSASDARNRVTVRLPNGKTGRLVFLDRSRGGANARVVLPSGSFVSAPAQLLEVVPEVDTTCESCGTEPAVNRVVFRLRRSDDHPLSSIYRVCMGCTPVPENDEDLLTITPLHTLEAIA